MVPRSNTNTETRTPPGTYTIHAKVGISCIGSVTNQGISLVIVRGPLLSYGIPICLIGDPPQELHGIRHEIRVPVLNRMRGVLLVCGGPNVKNVLNTHSDE